MLRAASFALVLVLLAGPAAAQFTTFPRIGASAAPDRYVGEIDVAPDETFQVHVLALGPDDDTPLAQAFQSFSWAILEACCGGAVAVVDVDLGGPWHHEGTCIGGMVSTNDACAAAGWYHLTTLTMRMVDPRPGEYYLMCGPIGLAQDCAGADVVMTDLPLVIRYAGGVAAQPATLGAVKSTFD